MFEQLIFWTVKPVNMTSFWRFLCFFAFWSFLVQFCFFLQKFKNGGRVLTRIFRFDSRLCFLQVFVILDVLLANSGCHRLGGLSAPGPPVGVGWFLTIPTPLNHSQSEVKIEKSWKLKKFAPQKKMKCYNNSIYKLQDRLFSLQGTSRPYLWNIWWHFSNFKNS